MLAQLDAPAMLFTSLALLLFLQDHVRAAAAVCVALVLVKETGAVVPSCSRSGSLRERRWRDAAWFVAPLLVLAPGSRSSRGRPAIGRGMRISRATTSGIRCTRCAAADHVRAAGVLPDDRELPLGRHRGRDLAWRKSRIFRSRPGGRRVR